MTDWHELEQKTARWMEKKFRLDTTLTNQRARGKVSTLPYEVDILGVKPEFYGLRGVTHWVAECKTNAIKRDDVMKFFSILHDIRDGYPQIERWYAGFALMVTSKHFDGDAILHAKQRGIGMYRFANNRFYEEVKPIRLRY